MEKIERILSQTGHRPWPLPAAPWLMRQTWVDLLFAHWPVHAGALANRIPAPLELDTFDGRAWIGVVPFAMHDLAVRMLPGVPTATNFLELNVRTYVRCNGKAGVYFFSLDASSHLAVTGAKTAFGLPYHHAEMSLTREGDWIRYSSERENGERCFRARYRPVGRPTEPVAGTLEHFLTERYALMNVMAGAVTSVDIHHAPWPLQIAEAEIAVNTIIGEAGIAIPDTPPLLHFSAVQPIVNWALVRGCPGE